MRLHLLGLIMLLAAALDARSIIQAQPYCAMYSDGSKSCGIPTQQSCDQSISGVGGYCTPDLTSQMRPDFFRLLPSPPQQQPAPSNQNNPQDPNWMPPPPGQ